MSVDQVLNAIHLLEGSNNFETLPDTSPDEQVLAPLAVNNCIGVRANGTFNRQLRCLRSVDSDGSNALYGCATWKYFRVQCPPTAANVMCNSLSGAYVAAITVCNQHL